VEEQDELVTVKFKVTARTQVQVVPGVIVRNTQGEVITATNSLWSNNIDQPFGVGKKGAIFSFTLPNLYEKGDYTVSVNAVSADLGTFYAWRNDAVRFYADRTHQTGAKVYPRFTAEVNS
jgi:hypothetical protein